MFGEFRGRVGGCGDFCGTPQPIEGRCWKSPSGRQRHDQIWNAFSGWITCRWWSPDWRRHDPRVRWPTTAPGFVPSRQLGRQEPRKVEHVRLTGQAPCAVKPHEHTTGSSRRLLAPTLDPAPNRLSRANGGETEHTGLDGRPRSGSSGQCLLWSTRYESGGPPGARTQNLRIKSPQLYQLS